MVELLVGSLKGFLVGCEALDTIGGGEDSGRTFGGESVINESDQEKHLNPAQSRDSFNGGNAVGNGSKGDTRGDVAGETKDLRDNVT